MIFVGTMANRFSDSTSEIDNLALLTALKDKYGVSQGMAVFNQLKWLVNPSAPTTIAVQESSYHLNLISKTRKQQLCCHATIYLHQCLTDQQKGRMAHCWR